VRPDDAAADRGLAEVPPLWKRSSKRAAPHDLRMTQLDDLLFEEMRGEVEDTLPDAFRSAREESRARVGKLALDGELVLLEELPALAFRDSARELHEEVLGVEHRRARPGIEQRRADEADVPLGAERPARALRDFGPVGLGQREHLHACRGHVHLGRQFAQRLARLAGESRFGGQVVAVRSHHHQRLALEQRLRGTRSSTVLVAQHGISLLRTIRTVAQSNVLR
jgi:hypothetical protein